MNEAERITRDAERLDTLIAQLQAMLNSEGWVQFEAAMQQQVTLRRKQYELPAGTGGFDELLNGQALRMEMQAMKTTLALPVALIEGYRMAKDELLTQLEYLENDGNEVTDTAPSYPEFDMFTPTQGGSP